MFDFLSQKFSGIFKWMTGKSRLSEKNIEDALQQVKDSLLQADVPYHIINDFLAKLSQEVVGQKVHEKLNPGNHFVKIVNEKMLEELLSAKVFVEEEEVDLEQDLEEDGRRYLAYVERLASEKELEITTEMLRGVVHTEVLDKAMEMEAQLIVIGKIYEQLSRMDSYYDEAEEMLRGAKCPVLIVKGETIVDDLYESA